MNPAALLFVLLLQFPPGCACLQVAAGSNMEPFEHVGVELFATVESQAPNEGVYLVEDVLFWPYGVGVVFLDRVPPVADPSGGYIYGVVPVGPKRVIHRDGFESGDTSAWSQTVGGTP